MELTVRLFGFLDTEYHREFLVKDIYQSDESTLTIQYLIKNILRLSNDEVIILVNGKFITNDASLKDGDEVKLFPPIAGG